MVPAGVLFVDSYRECCTESSDPRELFAKDIETDRGASTIGYLHQHLPLVIAQLAEMREQQQLNSDVGGHAPHTVPRRSVNPPSTTRVWPVT
jgi:hypothetical protein